MFLGIEKRRIENKWVNDFIVDLEQLSLTLKSIVTSIEPHTA